jgi:hypothetical protein
VSLNCAVVINNLLRYPAEKILLLNNTNFRGDYHGSTGLAVNGMDARVLWVRASVTGLLSQAILGKATDPYLYAHFEARGIHNLYAPELVCSNMAVEAAGSGCTNSPLRNDLASNFEPVLCA